MYRARADFVTGRYVIAGGRRLICIGNENFSPGDLIWTDGRCVYGNHYTGGAPYIPSVTSNIVSGIPLLMSDGSRQYFANGEVHPLSSGDVYRGMVNRGGRFVLIDNNRAMDAELDSDGNLYIAQGGYVHYNFIIEDYQSEPTRVIRNGETIADIDLMPYLQSAISTATQYAVSVVPPIPERSDRKDHDSYTRLYYTECQTWTGKVDEYGHYCFIVRVIGEVEHEKWALEDRSVHPVLGPDLGEDWIGISNGSRASCLRLYLFSDTGVIQLAEGMSRSVWLYTGEHYSEEHQEKLVEDHAIRIPIQDGYYYTYAGELDNLLYPKTGTYSANIYSPEGTLICTGPFHPMYYNLAIAKTGGDAYLISGYRSGLYVSKGGATTAGGELERITGTPYNFRLRRMKNLKKWKGD